MGPEPREKNTDALVNPAEVDDSNMTQPRGVDFRVPFTIVP